MRLAAVSVDLDEVSCYAAIHGLPMPDGDVAHAIYRRAVPRFEELFARQAVRATFFAIGRDLEAAQAREAIARLHGDGHEIGNHTYEHRYDLTRLPAQVMRDDVARGMDAIERATGERPSGFRAPGYTVTDALLAEVGELGATYDSSVFPCPAYYGAKAAAMGVIRARGRRSHSVLDDPRVLTAPADPYRIGAPYYRRGAGLRELPIGVTQPWSGRLPYIGTSVVLGGERSARLLTRAVLGRPLVNLELHGIDLADAELDGLGFLAPHQPDLRRSFEQKRAALSVAMEGLRAAGYEFVTLAEAAERLLP